MHDDSKDFATPEGFDPFAGGEIARVLATTEAQREIWHADQLGREASMAYNESASLALDGTVDAAIVQTVLLALVERHEALRATFGPDGTQMLIGARADLVLDRLDLRGSGPDAAQARLADLRRLAVETPFDLERGPLVRAALATVSDEEHELILTAHHIVCDGWSLGVLSRDFASLYRAVRDGRPAELMPALGFGEHILALDAPDVRHQTGIDEQYWVGMHDGGSAPLDLPRDRPRPPVRSFASGREDLPIDAPLATAVRALAARRGVSLFVALYGTFAALMGRLAGARDVTVGIAAAGQAAAGAASLVGHCVNLLPLRMSLDFEQSAEQLFSTTQAAVLDAYDHQLCTLGGVLRRLQLPRDPARLPLASVLFNLDSAIDVAALSDDRLRIAVRGNPRSFENFELFLNVSQTGDTLLLEAQYSTALFDQSTVRRWLELYRCTLQRLSADDRLLLLDALAPTASDLERLVGFNATTQAHDRSVSVDRLFIDQANATPDALAVVAGSVRLTYRALLQRANSLATELHARGVGPGDLVGISCSRNEHMLVAMLGILRSGAAYVPLDPSFPADRLEFMVRDAGLRQVVTDSDASHPWGFPSAEPLFVADLAPVAGERLPGGNPGGAAYVIYTSGSTGRPKGVRVPHRAVVNFLNSMRREPGMSATDRILAVTTLSFDIAVLELLLPLTVGATVVVASRESAADGQALCALLSEHGATMLQATPSTWRLLLDAGWTGSNGFRALVGGEPLPPDLAQALLGHGVQLWNMYGPTETTVWSTCHRVDTVDGPVPIGRPIANTRIDVVDDGLRLLPPGVTGELVIAGEGVALGYLARPDLTADRFVADPLAPRGAMRYRTGDLGRWRNDGTLECQGRIDHQVKIRGHRIELGEIESSLASHRQVQRTLAVTHEVRPGDLRLVAYFVPTAGAPDESDLRRHLAARLPEYMVPQHFVALKAIPLLPNGKVDRRALPAPMSANLVQAEAGQRTPTQQVVATTMEQVLSLPGIGNDQNFFHLGGHSLLATQLANALGKAFGIRVPLRTVFEAPTAAQLATWLDARQIAQAAPRAPLAAPAPTGEPGRAPLSLMQQRLWFLEQLEPGRVTYNTPSAHRLKGPLDVGALERSLGEMVRRQPILRTELVIDSSGEPAQRVLPVLTVHLGPIVDLSALPSEEREAALLSRMKALVSVPIPLGQAPLFRHVLYRLGPHEHVLFFMPHHAIWDGWSFDLFYEEMAALYGAYSADRDPDLPALATSYADFSAGQQRWLASKELHDQVDQWKHRLADLPPPLDLPTDRPRPPRTSGAGSTTWLSCSKAQVDAARSLGQSADATLFMTLLATYALLLSRLSGQTDLVIGTPVRGRNTAELEKVMGFFVNALPLRLRVEPQASFRSLLRDVREAVLDAFGAPDVPFEHLVRELRVPRDESRSPIYQAFFSFQDARQRVRRWGQLDQEQVLLFQPGTAEDLGLWFLDHGDGLTGGLTFNTDIFDPATALRFGERYSTLLDAALADPDAPVDTLRVATDDDCAELAHWSHGLTSETSFSNTVHELIAAQVARTPANEALVTVDERLDYAELDRRVNRLARLLRARGIAKGHLVGLCLDRSVAMSVAQLAIMRAGAAYVPLDPAYPEQRLRYMATDAHLSLLVADSSSIQSIEWPRQKTLLVDIDAALIERESDAALERVAAADAQPDDPAYVIYTSGSTGRPKGVVLPHRAVVNFLLAMQREPGLDAGDRLLAVTTLSFDIAVLELLLPLTLGATVVIASRQEATDGHALQALIDEHRVTAMQATPSTWRLLVEAGWSGTARFKALVGGEPLPPDLAALLLKRCSELWNMYGPTETTVWSTCWRVSPTGSEIFIGRPIANTTVRVLDAGGAPAPVGVVGEICIGGRGVATGYLAQPGLTAERFIEDRLSPGNRLYRTGDRGRWHRDGLLLHLGRLDSQVKLRGHRIELGEVEAQLASHPSVARVVCAVREAGPGDARLVAYIVSPGDPTPADLREHLHARLPDYMIPQHFVRIGAIPLLPNGKVSMQALPGIADDPSTRADAGFQAPQGEIEEAVARIWQRVLGVERVGRDDNFFDLGGHSLLAMRVVLEIEKEFGVRLGVRRLIFESLSQVAALGPAEVLSTDGAPAAAAAGKGWLSRMVRGLRG